MNEHERGIDQNNIESTKPIKISNERKLHKGRHLKTLETFAK